MRNTERYCDCCRVLLSPSHILCVCESERIRFCVCVCTSFPFGWIQLNNYLHTFSRKPIYMAYFMHNTIINFTLAYQLDPWQFFVTVHTFVFVILRDRVQLFRQEWIKMRCVMFAFRRFLTRLSFICHLRLLFYCSKMFCVYAQCTFK